MQGLDQMAPNSHAESGRVSLINSKPIDGQIPALDGFRGLAILLVMFRHFTIIPATGSFSRILVNSSAFGIHGVDLFFVLSGFLITGILLDSKGRTHFFRNFYMRRTLRICPLYYSIVSVSIFVLPALIAHVPKAASKLAGFATASADWPWYYFYVSNFLIATTNDWRHPILSVTWSLAIEEQFYLMWAVVVFLLYRDALRRATLCVVAFSVLARIALLIAGYSWTQVYVLTPCRLDALALGAWLAIVVRERGMPAKEIRGRVLGLACCATPVLLGLYAFGIFTYDSWLTLSIAYPIISVLFAAWLWVGITAESSSLLGRSASAPFLRFFGKYSYAIYLFHVPLRSVLRDTVFASTSVRAMLGNSVSLQIVFYLTATLAVLPLAWLSWRFLEQPILRLKRYFPR